MEKLEKFLSIISSTASILGSAAYAANMLGDSMASVKAGRLQSALADLEKAVSNKTIDINKAMSTLQSYTNQMTNIRTYIDPRMIEKLDAGIVKANELSAQLSNTASSISSKASQAQQAANITDSGIGYLYNEITGNHVDGEKTIRDAISQIEETAIPVTYNKGGSK